MDLTFDSTPRTSREERGKTARTPVERRQSTSPVPRKRRRHDGLHNSKRAPLEW
ncbi:MAG TPA: hypothetical protein VFS02_11110 [Telluria sp.]|nr:hypothetical protein [Telluria sp.]